MNFNTSSVLATLPVYLDRADLHSLTDSNISPFLLSYAESSDTLILEIGESRTNTTECVATFLDEHFPGLIDMAFDAEAEFIAFLPS